MWALKYQTYLVFEILQFDVQELVLSLQILDSIFAPLMCVLTILD